MNETCFTLNITLITSRFKLSYFDNGFCHEQWCTQCSQIYKCSP